MASGTACPDSAQADKSIDVFSHVNESSLPCGCRGKWLIREQPILQCEVFGNSAMIVW